MVFRTTVIIVTLALLAGCQQAVELRFNLRGSKVPRNPREKVIFDYFQALREERYEDAYRLRVGSDVSSSEAVARFAERHIADRSSLATKISTGQERKIESSDECEYIYTVYAFSPDDTILISGTVATASEPENPGVCLVGYNSAFGSVP